MCSDFLHTVLLQNYGQGWCGTKLSRLQEAVHSFEHWVVKISLLICSCSLFILELHRLEDLVSDIPRFAVVSILDTLTFKQFNASVETTYYHMYRRYVIRTDDIMSGLNKQKLPVSCEMSDGRENFAPSCANRKKALRMKRAGSHTERLPFSVSMANICSELSSRINPNPEQSTPQRLLANFQVTLFRFHAIRWP